MYFSDPITPTALAATGISLASGLTSVAVIIFAGLALVTIAKQIKSRNKKSSGE